MPSPGFGARRCSKCGKPGKIGFVVRGNPPLCPDCRKNK